MYLKNQHLTRQSDLIPTKILSTPIHIIGAGAVGSFATLSLAKMGFNNLRVWDFDEISIENMNCQFYRFSDIGKRKVDALKEAIQDYANVEIVTYDQLWEGEMLTPRGIVCCFADSMAVRRHLFDTQLFARLIVDTRMGPEFATLYAYQPEKDRDWYAKTLYSDEEAVATPCTAKATVYAATLSAGLAVKSIKDFLLEESYTHNVQWNIAANQYNGWTVD